MTDIALNLSTSTTKQLSSDTSLGNKRYVSAQDMMQKQQQTPQFDDFEVLTQIGQSKFPVYQAKHKKTEKIYALKLFPAFDSKSQHFFRNEISYSCLFSHKNIIKTHDIIFREEIKGEGRGSSISYIVQDFASNGDLFDLISAKGHFMSETILRSFFKQAVKGVEAMHKQHIAHLDIKLDNFLLMEDFELKLADFDLARDFSRQICEPISSMVYRAPEVREGNARMLDKADIYSLGIMLFTLNARGRFPFSENKENSSGLALYKKVFDKPVEFWNFHCRALKVTKEYFSKEFKALFTAMIDPNPEKRPTIQEIKESEWMKQEIIVNMENLSTQIQKCLNGKVKQ